MKSKDIKILLIISLIIGLALTSNIMAQEKEIIDPNIPESWYQAPQLASELDIDEFNQSPYLDNRVEEGDLLPVEERLPVDPPVIEPYKEVGKYGGTINIFDTNLNFWGNAMYFIDNVRAAGKSTPNASEMLPWYIKGWDFSNNYKDLTLHLRKGLRWSDGESFTADDYMYWWEHVAQNEELNPLPPEEWSPPLVDVTEENKWEITLHFGEPAPRYPDFNFQAHLGVMVEPAHYMKEFHPDFIGEEKANELAEEAELDHWSDLYGRIVDDSPYHPEYEYVRPTLYPYIATSRSETTLKVERNPYFPFIDTEGNQLPYIDKVRINLINSAEMAVMKASTGEATFEARYLMGGENIPLLKKNEEKEDYTTLLYQDGRPLYITQPNLTHPDPQLRAIFQDDRFRKALSLALDREDINERMFYGSAIPMQATVPPVNSYYEEKYGKAYAEYDPDRAQELLDDMGMIDRDGDGYREMPEGTLETMKGEKVSYDGERFNPTYITHDAEDIAGSIFELYRSSWHKIGLEIEFKTVSNELANQMRGGNNFDIATHGLGNFLDLQFGLPGHISKTLAPLENHVQNTWPAWSMWVESDGKSGEEPPEEIKKLVEHAQTLAETVDEEEREKAAKALLDAQAENLWTIGAIAMPPAPVVVSNKLHNVPKSGLWEWGTRYIQPYRPMQFYLEE